MKHKREDKKAIKEMIAKKGRWIRPSKPTKDAYDLSPKKKVCGLDKPHKPAKAFKTLSKNYINITEENFNKLPPVYQKIVRLINEENYSWQKACMKVGYAKGMSTPIKKRINKYAITSEKMEKKAFTVLNDVLDNKPKLQSIKEVKDKKTGKKIKLKHLAHPDYGQQIQVADMVLKRTQPEPKTPQKVEHNFNFIDLSRYKNPELLSSNDTREIQAEEVE